MRNLELYYHRKNCRLMKTIPHQGPTTNKNNTNTNLISLHGTSSPCDAVSKLPTLPRLPAHSNKPIKQLLPQRNSPTRKLLPTPRNNLNSIRNLPIRRPSDHQFRLPPQSSNLLQLRDILNRYRPHGFEICEILIVCAVSRVCAESHARDCGRGVDVNSSF